VALEIATTAPAAVGSGKYNESPLTAQMVKDGKLPAVDQRLPKNPYVVPHKWVNEGKYGGNLNWTNSWGGDGVSTIVVESMYGHTPLRWLRDGLEIGPGLVESWESNADTSQWTLHFREGLKWSDGKPWSVDDILFWWDDMVNDKEAGESPPDECRSGKNTLVQFKKVDDNTLQMIFDAPAPLTADRLAMWVKNVIGGGRWMIAKHYAEPLLPKNKGSKDWDDFKEKIDIRHTPACPTMNGWMLTEYNKGTSSKWARNPYYWVVNRNGDQLPYIDTINVTGYQDHEVETVNLLAGKSDWTHPWVLQLTDVAGMKKAQSQIGGQIYFWDSGSGSGTAYFFNYDYKDEKMRKLIREPKFRQALSLAQNRGDVQKNFYFGNGELTTGTFSPKAIEYNYNDQAKQVYKSWRDSFVKYDPETAKTMLDGIGVKVGAGGKRTFPDGSPLTITVDYHADTDKQTIAQDELLARDWQAIGIDAKLNPIPPQSFETQWEGGDILSKADWGIGDGPNHLVYPQWLVPLEASRWAPLEGKMYELRGTKFEGTEKDVDPYKRQPPRMDPEPGGPVEQLTKIYDQSKLEPDPLKRMSMVWDMIKLHVQYGPFVQGTVANFPKALFWKDDLKNVPKHEDLALGGFTDPWIHPTPAVYDPESWFWTNPDQHGV